MRLLNVVALSAFQTEPQVAKEKAEIFETFHLHESVSIEILTDLRLHSFAVKFCVQRDAERFQETWIGN